MKAVWITSAGTALHAKWVEITDADDVGSQPVIRYSHWMLRFIAGQLWQNLIQLTACCK
jgi:hypothetical protein